jgi:hypothetical protein
MRRVGASIVVLSVSHNSYNLRNPGWPVSSDWYLKASSHHYAAFQRDLDPNWKLNTSVPISSIAGSVMSSRS